MSTTTEQGVMWAVSHGEYSDYRVMCVAASEKDAKAIAAKYNATERWSQARVESLPLVGADVMQVQTLRINQNLWDNGSEAEATENYLIEWPFDSLYGAPVIQWRWVRAPVHNGRGGRLEVWGTDHERVRKVYGEKRAQLKTDDAMRARREIVR